MKTVDVAVVMFFMFLGTCAKAEELWLTATVRSYHLNRDKDYNENNFGLGVEKQSVGPWGWAAGFYENSHYRTTVYAGPTYRWRLAEGVSFMPCLCLATGYSHLIGIYPLPTFAIEGKQVGMNVAVAPSVIAFQLKWRFK